MALCTTTYLLLTAVDEVKRKRAPGARSTCCLVRGKGRARARARVRGMGRGMGRGMDRGRGRSRAGARGRGRSRAGARGSRSTCCLAPRASSITRCESTLACHLVRVRARVDVGLPPA